MNAGEEFMQRNFRAAQNIATMDDSEVVMPDVLYVVVF